MQRRVGLHQEVPAIPINGRFHERPDGRTVTINPVDKGSILSVGVRHRKDFTLCLNDANVAGLAATLRVEDGLVEDDAVGVVVNDLGLDAPKIRVNRGSSSVNIHYHLNH